MQSDTHHEKATQTTNYSVLGDANFPALSLKEEIQQHIDDQETVALPYRNDVWQRLRDNFKLADIDHPRIQRQVDWYARHPQYIDRVVERARPYMYFIATEVEAAGIPAELALLPIVESAFQPFAYSHGRASGIWQFISSTGRRYGLKQNWWYDGRRDVYASTRAAVRLLDNLQQNFNGNWLYALAAYNAGGGNVRKAIRRNKRRGKPIDFFSLRLPAETKAYVPKLLALKKIINNPEKYGITLAPIDNQPYLAKVETGSQIDLAHVAEMADVELDEVYKLNPGFNRWATAPDGPHYVLLPIDKADGFKTKLAELPREERIRWVRHTIRNGETLSTIAARYHTSIISIKKVNRIRGNFLRAGRGLTIPVASKKLRSYKLSANQRKKKLQNIPRKGIKVTHIVQTGDTFWELARRHKVGIRQLAKWNSMAPRDPLVPGQKIIIWSRTGDSVSHNNPDHLNITHRSNITKRIGYRVRNGDSLARIAQKFRVSISQLRRWNRLPKGKYLQPGQRLTLFVNVFGTSS
ncbi:MAG: LysM peptidoglycan-binding domain-containing protein [Gammaproteobacteria bacterium]